MGSSRLCLCCWVARAAAMHGQWLQDLAAKILVHETQFGIGYPSHCFDLWLIAQLTLSSCYCLRFGYGKQHVLITVSAGSAASRIGGATLHNAALGLQRGNEPVATLKSQLSRKAKENWKNVQVLIIEEYSLISSALLDLLDSFAKVMKKSKEALGGVRCCCEGCCSAGYNG